MNAKSRYILFFSLSLFIACTSQKDQQSNVDSTNWYVVRIISDSLYEDSNYESLFSYDSLIYNSDGKIITDLNNYVAFALNLLNATYSTSYKDVYEMLNIVKRQIQHSPDSITNKNIVSVANLYEQLGLYRSEYELFNLKKTLPDSILAKKDLISKLLSRWEYTSTTDIRDSTGNYLEKSKRITGRLCDLLNENLLTNHYDELDMEQSGADSLWGDNSDSEKTKPIFALLTGNKVKELVEDDPYEDDSTNSNRIKCHFTEILLDTYWQPKLKDLVVAAKTDRQDDHLISQPVIKQLYKLSHDSTPFFSLERSALYSKFFLDNSLILSLYEGGVLCVFIVKEDQNQKYKVYSRIVDYFNQIAIIDVTHQGNKQLFITSDGTTGGYYGAEILDVKDMSDIFWCSDLYHGGLSIVNIDTTTSKELITNYSNGNGVISCNQCPSIYESEIYEFNSKIGKYIKIGDSFSASEMSPNTNGGLMGIAQPMIRNLNEVKSGTNIFKLIDSIQNSNGSLLSTKDVARLVESFENEYEVLEFNKDNETAISLDKKMLLLFRSKRIDEKENFELKRSIYFKYLVALFSNNNYEEFQDAQRDEWYHSAIDTSNEYKSITENLTGLAYLQEGKFGEAYNNFLSFYKDYSENDDPSPAGNLALYYSLINDTASYFKLASEALDKSIRSGDNVCLNLLHVARAGKIKLTTEEQLDYLIRAMKIAKADQSGELILTIYEVGAELALENKEYELGLKMLDQAIEFTTSEDWRQMGADVMIVYSRLLLGLKLIKEPIYTLNTAIKLAKGISRSAYITGSFMLSQIKYEQNNLNEALYYSSQAFDSISSYRKTIDDVTHKFSFLTDKHSIVSWHLKLLLETNHTPTDIFKALESWKMSSFMDAYQTKGLYKSISHANVLDSFLTVISPSDMVIDFSVNDYKPFSITLTSNGSINISSITKTKAELSKLSSDIRTEMDINNPESLSHIRDDEPSSLLESNLRAMYTALFASLKIPPGIKRIVIIPDETLYGIPWSALKIDNNTYLIDRFEYNICPSASIGYAIKRKSLYSRSDFSKKALIVASLQGVSHQDILKAIPSLSANSKIFSLSELSNGSGEAIKVAASLKQHNINIEYLLDEKTNKILKSVAKKFATRQNFLLCIDSVAILHCVAHGLFNQNEPMQSCLFMAEDSFGERLITANDLININLSNLSLVSLSGCQTGNLNLSPGAEPIGFLRAFIGAGTSNVLLTDWEVDDKATGELFEKFYSNLNFMPISKALNDAKLSIRKEHRHPYFWASVALYGSP